MNQPLRFLALLLSVLLLAVIAGCIITEKKEPEKPIEFKPIPRFESYEQLSEAFVLSRERYRQYGIAESISNIGTIGAPMQGTAAESAAPDFSRTNVQVEGVDEADIVKTDGKYIYTISSPSLVIAEAFPIENARIVSKTQIAGTDKKSIYPEEMFVFGNKLLVFGRKNTAYFSIGRPYYGSGMVSVVLFDVSDKSNPALEKEIEIEGAYLTSRLIGKHAYFVVNSQPKYSWDKPVPLAGSTNSEGKTQKVIIPVMIENGVKKTIAVPEEIGYLPPVPLNSFLTIASLNLETGEMQKETIVGNAGNVFASQDNIFVASTAWLPPETPVVQDIERIVVGDKEKTVVTKFGLKEGKIGFVGQGIVPGHILNQFSMDEFEGNFRIATTVGEVWNEKPPSVNNLYVLDTEMNVIGRLEDLAPGEKIYSARFIGNKAYLVTFKKVDPLFVIDLSDASNPVVLGKLKIPGYSDYLHPFDETHLIGVGKETIESKQGDFAWYQGMKLAIFDVSDVSNPIELHKLTIGDRGTESYALQDHKAFLFDREKQLLVLPIKLAEIFQKDKENPQYGFDFPAYGEPVFQGAFVYNVSLENGFVERGRITHVSPEEELKRGYYFDDFTNVKRALYIGSVLYTVSEKMIKANDLISLQELEQLVLIEKDELYPTPNETTTR